MIYSIANQKGGVGKTATAFSLASGLTERGYKVLAIDLDPQSNLTRTLGEVQGSTILDVLTERISTRNCIIKGEICDYISSTPLLAGIDIELERAGKGNWKEQRLKWSLEEVLKDYDYIVIDTPPTAGTLMYNALTVSDRVIIPLEASKYSIDGLKRLLKDCNEVKEATNKNLVIDGLLISRYRKSALKDTAIESIIEGAQTLGTRVYKTYIREAVALEEAITFKKSPFVYAPKSKVVEDLNNFINEIAEPKKGKNKTNTPTSKK